MNQIELQDERIREERRKIQSRGYSLVVWALMISILVQMLMKAPASQYAAEFLVLIGCGIYQMIANLRRGIDIWQNEQSAGRKIGTTAVAAVIAALLLTVLQETRDLDSLLVFLLVFLVANVGLRQLLTWLTKRKQKAMNAELDDEEEQDR